MNRYEKKDEDKNMTRDELLKRINNKEYESNMEYPKGKIIPEDTILDEDLTIKQNRELVKEKNEEYRAKRQEYWNVTAKREYEFQNDVTDYVLSQSKYCKREQIEKIEEYISEDGQFSSKKCFLILVEEFAQRFDELMDL